MEPEIDYAAMVVELDSKGYTPEMMEALLKIDIGEILRLMRVAGLDPPPAPWSAVKTVLYTPGFSVGDVEALGWAYQDALDMDAAIDADRYFVGNGVGIGKRWSAIANWSTSTGGAGGSAVPTAADDVYLDDNSGDCDLNENAVAKSFTTTDYADDFTMSGFSFTISGAITTGAGGTWNAAGSLICIVAATLVFDNGMTFTHGNGEVFIDADMTLAADGITFYDLTVATPGTVLTFTAADTITTANNFKSVGSTASPNSMTCGANYTIDCNGAPVVRITVIDHLQLPIGDSWTVYSSTDNGNNDVR